jgi:hypothetical protein
VGQPDAALTPSILSGHSIEAPNQIVLGAATLAQLHKRIGDVVVASYGRPRAGPEYVPPTRLNIVGTATLPAVGNAGSLHVSMGTGAIIPTAVEPAAFKRLATNGDPLHNGVRIAVVRLRADVSPAAGYASLQAIARAVTKTRRR